MPSLPQAVLYRKLIGALPGRTTVVSAPEEVRPLIAEIPGFGRLRAYLWTLTHIGIHPGRKADEFKIELILPKQSRDTRGSLDLDDSAFTLLLGYSPDYGVFAAWDPRHHEHFGYSSHVQIRENVLVEAHASGWAVAPRRTTQGQEVTVAFAPSNLVAYAVAARSADSRDLDPEVRELFFIEQTPRVGRLPPRAEGEETSDYTSRLRDRITTTRLSRDQRFGRKVRDEFSDACAVCSVQLEVVEGAHIISVNEKGSSDDIWNGVALCRNHHKLFDARILRIRPNLQVWSDWSIIEYLRDMDRAAGFEVLLEPFENTKIQAPRFYGRDRELREKMTRAMQWREDFAGMT
jgi:putative restriction endonuclease